MEVVNVLHMNGGTGDASYANNSSIQKKVLLMTKPIVEQAISDLYCSLYLKSLSIADLGCSSGPNTLLLVSQLIDTIYKTCKRIGNAPPEIQIHLNDLPTNDFNAIFKSLPHFHEKLRKKMGSSFAPCFFNGVPGSFYGRLFPTNSLHFIHSSYSLHWLSQIPNGVENNEGNICMSSTSPSNVLKAYYEQFEKDFLMFLKFRWVELTIGGHMVLTFMGRKSEDPRSKESCYTLELLARVLNEMVLEGIIQEKELHTFNVPVYTPSPEEVKSIVEKERFFRVNQLQTSELNWCGCDSEHYPSSRSSKDCGYSIAKCIRAVTEPVLASHFGEAIMDEVFSRYQKIVTNTISKEKTVYANVTISMTKIMDLK